MTLVCPAGSASMRYGSSTGHRPVMLSEVVDALAPRGGGRYLDATFGGGGHTAVLLDASAPDGLVLTLDADDQAVARAQRLAREPCYAKRLRVHQANFATMAAVAAATGPEPGGPPPRRATTK